MRKAFAIATAKAKKRCHTVPGGPENNADVSQEISRAGMGIILCLGAVIGLGGFIFLAGGIIRSGGFTAFVKGWFTAFTGI